MKNNKGQKILIRYYKEYIDLDSDFFTHIMKKIVMVQNNALNDNVSDEFVRKN